VSRRCASRGVQEGFAARCARKSYLIKVFLVLLILCPIPGFFPAFFHPTTSVGGGISAFISKLPYRL
jgi:hypothetical protein